MNSRINKKDQKPIRSISNKKLEELSSPKVDNSLNRTIKGNFN